MLYMVDIQREFDILSYFKQSRRCDIAIIRTLCGVLSSTSSISSSCSRSKQIQFLPKLILHLQYQGFIFPALMCDCACSTNSHRILSDHCRLWPSLLPKGSPESAKENHKRIIWKAHTASGLFLQVHRAAAQRFCWLVAKICERHPNLVIMRCFVVITRCCSHNYKMLSHIPTSGAYLMYKYKTT